MPPSMSRGPSGILLALSCITFLSLCTTFAGYASPSMPLLDEHYYITDAQRLLHGVFYLKHNPPLGKLLIAAGERLLPSNDRSDHFLKEEVASSFPPVFSFRGYRLFPALMAWALAPLFAATLMALGIKPLRSALLSLPVVFDTALIVHARAAMLDGPLTFFCIATLLCLALQWRRKLPHCGLAALGGAAFGCAMSVKFVAAPMALLFAALVLHHRKTFRPAMAALGSAVAAALIVMLSVWQVNFGLMNHTIPELSDHGRFSVSQQFIDIIESPGRWAPWNLPLLLTESAKYAKSYNDRIGPGDLCKDDELGSLPFLWPLGHKSMRYLWAQDGQGSGHSVIMAPNVVTWGLGLFGLCAAAALVIGGMLTEWKLRRGGVIASLLVTYGVFMALFLHTHRVLFLYHYFVPLILTLVLFALVTEEIRRWRASVINLVLTGMMLLCFFAYQFFLPFVLYDALTKEQFEHRAKLWPMLELQCNDCLRPSPFLTTRKQ